VYIEAGGTRLLVDAGLPPRELAARLLLAKGAPSIDAMDGLLLTHEHGDHAKYAGRIAERGVPVYGTASTLAELDLTGPHVHAIVREEAFRVGQIDVLPVPLPHDAADPVGFVLMSDDGRVGLLTDCGHASYDVAAAYRGCDVLLLEANYDPDLLRLGSYPPSLKRRIGGALGHLSNAEAAELIRLMGKPAPRCIVLAHLSQLCNRAQLARAAVTRAIGRQPVRLMVAQQGRPLPPIEVSVHNIQVSGGLPGEQLTFLFGRSPAGGGEQVNQ
jgi:phosphoribosyl 1,2-cyclic phosphodiesterase